MLSLRDRQLKIVLLLFVTSGRSKRCATALALPPRLRKMLVVLRTVPVAAPFPPRSLEYPDDRAAALDHSDGRFRALRFIVELSAGARRRAAGRDIRILHRIDVNGFSIGVFRQ